MSTAQQYIALAEARLAEAEKGFYAPTFVAMAQVYATLAQAKATDELHTVLDARLVEP